MMRQSDETVVQGGEFARVIDHLKVQLAFQIEKTTDTHHSPGFGPPASEEERRRANRFAEELERAILVLQEPPPLSKG